MGSGSVAGTLGTALVVLVIAIIVFLVFREVVCWYWKINKTVDLLTEIRDLLAHRSATGVSTGGSSGHRDEPTFQSIARAVEKDIRADR